MGQVRDLSYEERNALLKYWQDDGIEFVVKDGLLHVFSNTNDQGHLKRAMETIRPLIPQLKEEWLYQNWCERSLEDRGIRLDALEFIRHQYEAGKITDWPEPALDEGDPTWNISDLLPT